MALILMVVFFIFKISGLFLLELLRLGSGLWESKVICKDSNKKNRMKGCGSIMEFLFCFFERRRKKKDHDE